MPLAKPIGFISPAAQERFYGKVAETESGCLVWTGNQTRNGYGQFWINTRMVPAHRVAWVMERGEQPATMQLDHLCRNKLCVSVDHLELTTPRQNTRRAVAENVWSREDCRNGHNLAAVGFYFDKKGSRVCRECKRVTARKQWAKKRAAILGGDPA